MVRGKTIGALEEATKVAFQMIHLKDKWKNYNLLLLRMIDLYNRYNEEYEAELKRKESDK